MPLNARVGVMPKPAPPSSSRDGHSSSSSSRGRGGGGGQRGRNMGITMEVSVGQRPFFFPKDLSISSGAFLIVSLHCDVSMTSFNYGMGSMLRPVSINPVFKIGRLVYMFCGLVCSVDHFSIPPLDVIYSVYTI